MRKIILIMLLALLSISLSSCGFIFGDDEYIEAHFKSSERAEEKCEKLIEYINNKDAAGIRDMFSEESKNEAELDSQIKSFLNQFPNGMTEYEIGGCWGSTGAFDNWTVQLLEETAVIFIPKKGLSSGDEDQHISIRYTFANKSNPDRVGVNNIIWNNRLSGEEIIIGPAIRG